MAAPVLTARFTMDEAYFREDLAQWTAAVSRNRKWSPWIAITMIAAASTIAAVPGDPTLLIALALLVGGLLVLLNFSRGGTKWLEARRASDKFGCSYEFTIGEAGVQQIEPPTENQLQLIDLVPSKRGIILRFADGHVYIPASSITPALSREELLRHMTRALMVARDP